MSNGAAPPAAFDVLRKSVTRDDYNTEPTSGVMHWIIPALGSAAQDLPQFWSFARDQVLASTLYRESMWADAISIAIGKIAARGFDVDSDVPLRTKRAQDLFLNFDSGHGYVSGLQKHLQNFLLTGNGAHVEIVRATRALGSRILGLVPLDTFRCRRTGDPDFPIIYRDRYGREHIMREWDVFSLTDMPDPADTWYGVGHCAAERAYKAIIKLEAIERYIFEKVTGQKVLAFHIVGGVTPQNLEDAKKTAQSDAQAKGVTTYMGAAIVAMMGDTPASVVTIPLAELPDGFLRKEEWDIALTTYARALGIAVQDLQPLSGQGLGTGAQTQVLDEAAKGQGLAVWSQQWEHAVNEYALDDRTTYAIKTHDIRDREREAKVRIDEAAALTSWYNMGLTAQQAINLGVDRDQLPEEYRPEDLTPGEQLSDDEKPAQEQAEAAAAPPDVAPANPPPPAAPAKPARGAPGTLPAIKQLADSIEQAKQFLNEYREAEAATEKERQDADDVVLAAALKELAEAARQPQVPPEIVVNVPAAVMNVPAPIVNLPAPVVNVAAPIVQAPPATVIRDDAATIKALGALGEQVAELASEQRRPRKLKVTRRDAQGRVEDWEER